MSSRPSFTFTVLQLYFTARLRTPMDNPTQRWAGVIHVHAYSSRHAARRSPSCARPRLPDRRRRHEDWVRPVVPPVVLPIVQVCELRFLHASTGSTAATGPTAAAAAATATKPTDAAAAAAAAAARTTAASRRLLLDFDARVRARRPRRGAAAPGCCAALHLGSLAEWRDAHVSCEALRCESRVDEFGSTEPKTSTSTPRTTSSASTSASPRASLAPYRPQHPKALTPAATAASSASRRGLPRHAAARAAAAPAPAAAPPSPPPPSAPPSAPPSSPPPPPAAAVAAAAGAAAAGAAAEPAAVPAGPAGRGCCGPTTLSTSKW